MKVHIGCGSVYLRDWFNIDLPGPNTFLADARPDLVERWGTDDEHYYAKHQDKSQDSIRKGPLDQEYVCDRFGDFGNIPVPSWHAEEILARHSFEHLSITEAHKALDEADSILKTNGILRLDVPDHEETLRLYKQTGDDFYIRHLLGPRRNDHGFHMMSYTRDRLRALVESHGFVYVEEEPNIHFYPAFCLRFIKPGPRTPVDYVAIPDIPDHWRVLEIGPGDYPLMRADVYLDHDISKLQPLKSLGKATIHANLMSLCDIPDKAFDYVWCSHVFEHLEDPIRCANTLSRIAKRGTLVMPSAMKEGLFAFEESDHKWLVLPNPSESQPPIFIRYNRTYIDKLRDIEFQKISSRLFRTGPNRNGIEQRYLRKWFYENEAALDVVWHWSGELKLQVIG